MNPRRRSNPQALWSTPEYRRRRKRLLASANARSRCWRCDRLLGQHQPHKDGTAAYWTAGHVIDGNPRSPLALEASTCNYRAGGSIGGRMTSRSREPRSPNG